MRFMIKLVYEIQNKNLVYAIKWQETIINEFITQGGLEYSAYTFKVHMISLLFVDDLALGHMS